MGAIFVGGKKPGGAEGGRQGVASSGHDPPHTLKVFAAQVLHSARVLPANGIAAGGSASSSSKSSDASRRGAVYAYCGYQSPSMVVECCGVVVEVHRGDKYTLFTIDDATSLLQCMLWRPNTSNDNYKNNKYYYNKRRKTTMGGGLSIESTVWSEVNEERYEQAKKMTVLGSQVKVRGRLHSYKGQIQVKVASLCQLCDPNAETEHRLDTERLHRQVYDART